MNLPQGLCMAILLSRLYFLTLQGSVLFLAKILACKSGTHFKARTLTWRGFLKNVTLHISKQELLPLRENKKNPTAFPTYQRQRLACS